MAKFKNIEISNTGGDGFRHEGKFSGEIDGLKTSNIGGVGVNIIEQPQSIATTEEKPRQAHLVNSALKYVLLPLAVLLIGGFALHLLGWN